MLSRQLRSTGPIGVVACFIEVGEGGGMTMREGEGGGEGELRMTTAVSDRLRKRPRWCAGQRLV